MQLWVGQLGDNEHLLGKMFRDQATIFRDRMGWDVSVDDRGYEMDEYDIEGLTLYTILHEDGVHQASPRITPVTEACMALDHFEDLRTLDMIEEPERCAEVTRFYVAVDDKSGVVSRELMFANARVIYEGIDFDSCLGVFYRPMLRVYKRIGFEPVVLNQVGKLCVGQWTKARYEEILANEQV
jgi:acyl homoserine lactone synthase